MVAFTDKSDDAGRLTELVYTDATPEEIREFEWIYDAAGRIVAHNSDIDSEDVNDYAYDAAGQLVRQTDPLGNSTYYEYDSLGRVVAERNYSTDGLTGYWNFDEGTGSTAGDSSDSDIDGTLYGPAWSEDGRYGSALDFDGSDDYVALGTPDELNSELVTFAAWVKADTASPAENMFVLNRQNANPGTVGLLLEHGTQKWAAQVRLDGSESTVRIIYSNAVATTDWTFLAMTYDGETLRLYVNGVLQADTFAISGTIDTDSFTSINIGRHPTSGRYFDGMIDNMMIYDRPLSAEEITSLGAMYQTTYAYDAAGRLLSLTDPEENATTYEYDALGRVVAETNELDAERNFVYNAAGQLVRRIDREDRVTVYQYDSLGRNTAEIWYADATDADADDDRLATITYVYDAAGRMLMATSPLPPGEGQGEGGATYQYAYDDLGRVIEETQTIDGLASEIALSYELSAMGLVEKVSVAIGGTADTVTDYEYDALGRVTRIEQYGVQGGNAVAEKRIDLAYDAQSRYATMTRYADLAGTDLVATATYTFDAAYRLVGLDYDKGVTSLASYDYAYDAAGNMLSMTTIDGTVDYTSDDTGQLTDADYDYQTDESHTYDDNGNIVTTADSTYTTGDNNQLICDGTYTYEYDDEGNRTLKYVDEDEDGVFDSGDTDITEYGWDHRNRLEQVEHFTTWANYDAGTSDQIVSYTYDCFNQLVSRTLDSDGTSGSTDVEQSVYVYDSGQIAAQFDKTGSGDLAATDMTHRYLWNPQAVDQLFADEQIHYDGGFVTDDMLFALTDHQNSVRDLVEYDSGTDTTSVVLHRIFDAYGNNTSETGTAECLFGYTGKLFDEATELQNNWLRWYDAAVGRWLNEDPISFMAGDTNLYRYVHNNTLRFTDPTGLVHVESNMDKVGEILDAPIGTYFKNEWRNIGSKYKKQLTKGWLVDSMSDAIFKEVHINSQDNKSCDIYVYEYNQRYGWKTYTYQEMQKQWRLTKYAAELWEYIVRYNKIIPLAKETMYAYKDAAVEAALKAAALSAAANVAKTKAQKALLLSSAAAAAAELAIHQNASNKMEQVVSKYEDQLKTLQGYWNKLSADDKYEIREKAIGAIKRYTSSNREKIGDQVLTQKHFYCTIQCPCSMVKGTPALDELMGK